MSNARELVTMRTVILAGLQPSEVRAVNFHAIADTAGPALARGWSGDEIARVALGNIATAKNVGAAMVANIRVMHAEDPPRTPQPPPFSEVHAAIHARHTPAHTPAEWAARIRTQLTTAPQPRRDHT